MAPKSSIALLIACVILSTACAHNITKILEKDPKFSNFNQMLTETGLAKEINGRRTITVLAVPNDNCGSLNGKSVDVLTNILKTHIVLDYYDTLKLSNLKGKFTTMTTLFQSTGVAHYSQGFLNVTKTHDGGVIFGSAVKNAPRDVRLLGPVAALPYNISVLSISGPISTPGLIDGTDLEESAPSPKEDSASSPPAPSKKKEEVYAEDPEAPPSPPAEAPAPVDAEAPGASPPKPDADDADDAEAPDADEKSAPGASSAGKMVVSTVSMALVVVSWIAFL